MTDKLVRRYWRLRTLFDGYQQITSKCNSAILTDVKETDNTRYVKGGLVGAVGLAGAYGLYKLGQKPDKSKLEAEKERLRQLIADCLQKKKTCPEHEVRLVEIENQLKKINEQLKHR